MFFYLRTAKCLDWSVVCCKLKPINPKKNQIVRRTQRSKLVSRPTLCNLRPRQWFSITNFSTPKLSGNARARNNCCSPIGRTAPWQFDWRPNKKVTCPVTTYIDAHARAPEQPGSFRAASRLNFIGTEGRGALMRSSLFIYKGWRRSLGSDFFRLRKSRILPPRSWSKSDPPLGWFGGDGDRTQGFHFG